MENYNIDIYLLVLIILLPHQDATNKPTIYSLLKKINTVYIYFNHFPFWVKNCILRPK